MNVESLDRAIEEIYEAALQPVRWERALASTLAAIKRPRWDVGCLLWENAYTHRARFVASAEIEPDIRDEYCRTFSAFNPLTDESVMPALGAVVDSDELMGRDRFKETRFYRGFAGRWGIERFIGTFVDRVDDDRLLFVTAGPQVPGLSSVARGIGIVAPHLRRAARINRRLGDLELTAAGSTAALDLASSAVVLLQSDLSVSTCNAKAAELIDGGELDVKSRRLVLPKARDHARLLALADRPPLSSEAFRFESHRGTMLVAIAVRLGDRHVKSFGGTMGDARLLLLVNAWPPDAVPWLDPVAAAVWWDLTPVEAEITTAVVTGHSTDKIARARGVTQHAVRWHLKQIFLKTGTHSRAELTAMIARTPRAPCRS